MRLIDADALANRMQFLIRIHHRDAFDALNEIDNAPTIDPESLRPQGRWIRGEQENGERRHKCSVCRDECRVPTVVGKPIYDYCPNCGAKMKGAET